MLALFVLAFAGPLLNRGKPIAGEGPLIFLIDNGWASAAGWQRRIAAINEFLIHAEQSNRSVLLVPTADTKKQAAPLSVLSAEQAIETLRSLEPKPWWPDRAAAIAALEQAQIQSASIFWISDNLAYPGDDVFVQQLAEFGDVSLLVDEKDPLMLSRSQSQDASLQVSLTRPRSGEDRQGELSVAAVDGTVIGYFPFEFRSPDTTANVLIDLPLKLRNAIGRIAVRDERSAGSTVLLDDSQQRRSVGVVALGDQEDEQPLLSDTYYLRRAIDPFAEIIDGNLGDLIKKDISVLILSDVGQIVGNDLSSVADWVEGGGVLIRFAGPRLAAKRDELVPVNLRAGGRAFGGALSWESPQKLKAFDKSSPFFGIPIGADVEIRRQVLAEPSIELANRTWAQLEDGTPLVTAASKGDGWLILVHVTANSNWSNLPLSGTFVSMLRNMINISATSGPVSDENGAGDLLQAAGGRDETAGALSPLRILDGFGAPREPSSDALPIRPGGVTAVNSSHPPGIYGRRNFRFALNIGDGANPLEPIGNPRGLSVQVLEPPAVIRLQSWLLSSAILLLLADWVLMVFFLSGRGIGFRAAKKATVGAVITCLTLFALPGVTLVSEAKAASDGEKEALAATLQTHLAYVVTGNQEVDRLSRAGLVGLGRVLAQRTAVEPGEPIAVDLEKDELAFFPLLFWAVAEDQEALSPDALSKVDAYMKNGGTILFDTRDQQKNVLPQLGSGSGSGQQKLTELIGSLDIPPLMPLKEEHVLTKSFYLLDTFPGRWAGGRVWVEAQNEDTGSTQSSNDGVSSIIIGSNDWAAAWARDDNGRPIAAVVPGGARQRELAMRFGVNLVMYALTGNYKADSVHIPALLERLGQ